MGDHEDASSADDSEEDLAWQLESRLTSHGIYVTEFEETEAGYRLEYESMAAVEGSVPHREIGRVVNVFLDLHPDDWGGDRIEATVTDLDGEVKGEWYARAEWLAALLEGDLSETEFSQRVLETLET